MTTDPRFEMSFETSCAGGAPQRMKRDILAAARFQREDVHRYTVAQRVFETVLRCLDEPLRVAEAQKLDRKSTKRIL